MRRLLACKVCITPLRMLWPSLLLIGLAGCSGGATRTEVTLQAPFAVVLWRSVRTAASSPLPE
jgi:hypothetical protein